MFNLMNHNKYFFVLVFILLQGPLISWSKNKKCPPKSLQPQTVLELPPSKDNPRNSEGDFIILKNGRILFVYSHYTGNSSDDNAPAFLAGRYSDDGGKHWSKKDMTIVSPEKGVNIMSVTLLRLHNGNIALFYVKKHSNKDCIPQMQISKNEAKSWSISKPIINDTNGFFVLNNSRVIQLKSGRLLLPVALHYTPGGKWSDKAKIYCYYSDNNGKKWSRGLQVPDTTNIVTQEPGVVELNNGQILMYMRSNNGVQQYSYSKDKGKSWNHIQPSTILSPLSPASIKRIPGTNHLLLVWNNNNGLQPQIKDKRTPLSIAVSKNNGKSWLYTKNIEINPYGWYCYTAICFVDRKHILLGFCAGDRSKHIYLSNTNIVLLNKSLIYK